MRVMDILERAQQRAAKKIKGLEHHTYEERLRASQPREEKAWGDLSNVYKYPMAFQGNKKQKEKRGNGHNLNTGKVRISPPC